MSKQIGDIQQECLTLPENAAIIAALFDVEGQEKRLARRVVVAQIVTIAIVAGMSYVIKGSPHLALSVLCGGGISVVNGALLAWRMSQRMSGAALTSVQNVHHQLRLMYFYAAERLLVVAVLLGLCLAVPKLLPLAVLSGFVVGQAVLLIARLFLTR